MLLVIGVIIGLVLGLTGAGGSVFAVPLLMLFASMSANDAMGLALAAVALSASFGILVRWRSKQFYLAPALLLGLTGVITAPLGKWAAQKTPENVLELLFTALAVALALRMWQQSFKNPEATKAVRADSGQRQQPQQYICRHSQDGKLQLKPKCLRGLLSCGLLVGFASGFLGVGGGFMIIPILLFLSPMPMAMAVGTSLLIIAPVSLSGFASYYFLEPALDISQMGFLVAGAIIGMALGTALARRLSGPLLQQIFAASLMALAIANVALN